MRTALSLLAFAFALDASAQLPVVELGAGMHIIKAEFADTFQTRARGLMHREKLAQNACKQGARDREIGAFHANPRHRCAMRLPQPVVAHSSAFP